MRVNMKTLARCFRICAVAPLIWFLPSISWSQLELGGENEYGFFVEPGLTFERGDSKVTYPFDSSSGRVQGFGALLRAGGHVGDIFFAGLDGRISRPHFTDSSFGTESYANQWNWGLFVGAQTPWWGIRVWGTYVIGSELDPDADKSFDVKFTEGNGFRFGLGGRVYFFAVNLEYQEIVYDSTRLQSVGSQNTNLSFTGTEEKNKAFILSASFPFSL